MSFQKDSLSKFFYSKWLLIVCFFLFLFLAIIIAKEIYRSNKISQEIQELQNQIVKLEGGNQELQSFVEYLKTDRYMEEQARLNFSLKSPNEKVIVLQEKSKEQVSPSPRSIPSNPVNIDAANPGKWFDYFFGV